VTLNLYVMPLTGGGTSVADGRNPKYRSDWVDVRVNWTVFHYGGEPWCLVGFADIPSGLDTTLQGRAQVHPLPADLDVAVGGAANAISNALESVNIPGTWVTGTDTWRDIALFVGAVCNFAMTFQAITKGGLWFTGGVTLDSTYGSLPATARDGLLSAFQAEGLDTTGLTASSTLRQVIRSAGVQYVAAAKPMFAASISLYEG
jgi:hypothetical protein